jgi:hypothetical protein
LSSDKAVGSNRAPFPANNIPFHTIAEGLGLDVGYNQGYVEPANLAINDQSAWSRVWTHAFCGGPNTCPPTPEVDFNSRTLLALFAGQESTLGYSISVLRIERTGSTIVVRAKSVIPGSNCLVGQAITHPFHIVDIPKTTLEVKFTTETHVRNC